MKKFLIALFIFLPGCAYYRITDPASGREYYTPAAGVQNGANGAIGFRDHATGDWVVLQNHEDRIISEQEYHDMTFGGK